MGILDRIILTIYTVALTLISAAIVALAAGWLVPLREIERLLADTNGRWATGLVGLVFFVASVRLLYFAFRRRGGGRGVVHESNLGEVRISMDAVENLVSRVARQQRGVRDVRSRADYAGGQISVNLRTWVGPDVSVPELSELLQREVARYVRNVIGIDVSQVRVQVVSIAEGRRGKVELE